MQLSGVEVGAVRPDDGVELVVELHLAKAARIGKRAVDLADQNWPEVDRLAGAVVEFELQREVGYLLHVYYAVDFVSHDESLAVYRLPGARRC